VWIERFDHIPSNVLLLEKTPKIDDKHEMCKQHFAKALACSCEHLGVIKFLPMHSKPWRLTHCGGMGACFEKCWITIPNTHPYG
jgi:hypothetical protein